MYRLIYTLYVMHQSSSFQPVLWLMCIALLLMYELLALKAS